MMPEISRKSRSGSLIKRSSTGSKKKSSATTTSYFGKNKSRGDLLIPENLSPEFNEAWTLYVTERSEEYQNFIQIYKTNEESAKMAHMAYLKQLDKSKVASEMVDMRRNDLFLVLSTSKNLR